MLTINCLLLSRAHDRSKGKTQNSTNDLKGAENLHRHAQAGILSTDAFKLQISAQKRRLALCW